MIRTVIGSGRPLFTLPDDRFFGAFTQRVEMTNTDKLSTERLAVVVKPLDLSNMLRHAFLWGRLGPGEGRLTDADVDAWAAYDPSGSGPFERVSAAIDALRSAVEDDAAVERAAKAVWAHMVDKNGLNLVGEWEDIPADHDFFRAYAHAALNAAALVQS